MIRSYIKLRAEKDFALAEILELLLDKIERLENRHSALQDDLNSTDAFGDERFDSIENRLSELEAK